jgi:rhamnosyltransferase
VAVAYGRQLPKEDCREAEKFTRSFNYPDKSYLKSKKDTDTLGIKTYFCSNVCALYRRDIFDKLGGFTKRTIFNEDMIFAGGAVKEGYSIAYVAEAMVIHSHNYGNMEQFRRNFDLGVSQKEHPEIFEGIKSESEGIRLVKKTAAHLWKNKCKMQILPMIVQSGFKFLGYRFGKNYTKLSKGFVIKCSMNKSYWQ